MHNNEVLQIARGWLGTPYKHQASLKGVGCDCIGLIIGVWRELFKCMPDNFTLPPYTARWAEETRDELMTTIARQYLIEIPVKQIIPGDVVMYRMMRRGPTKHAGILSTHETFIHAYNGHDVIESPLITNVGSTMTHAFRFPENPDEVTME